MKNNVVQRITQSNCGILLATEIPQSDWLLTSCFTYIAKAGRFKLSLSQIVNLSGCFPEILKSGEMSTRFVHVTVDDVNNLKKKDVSKSTNAGTSNALKTFLSFCTEMNVYSINVIEKEELRDVLTRFYAGARTEKGEFYKVNSMQAIRNGLQRHFLETRKIDIINDDFFRETNSCFHNILKKIRSSTKGQVKHHAEIEPEDMKKLYRSIDSNTPTGLLEKVWIDMMVYFIRRARENQREMTVATFEVGVDASGKRFVAQSTGEIDKNHDALDDTAGEGRMYETGKESCPFESFVKYCNHLNPKQLAFWQKPKEKLPSADAETVWYQNAPLGPKSLGGMLAKLSVKYKLSQRYTNHCLRVTSLQALDDNNVDGRHIIRVSGHKSQESIKTYARKLSAARKRNISAILSSTFDNNNDNENLTPPQMKEAKLDATTAACSSRSSEMNESFPSMQRFPPPSVSMDIFPDDCGDDDFFAQLVPNNVL